MKNKKVIYSIIGAFLIGIVSLILLSYYAIGNMNSLLDGNRSLMSELKSGNHLRTVDRDLLGVEARIRAAIATDDISHLQGIDTKIDELEQYLDSLRSRNSDRKTQTYLGRLEAIAEEKLRNSKKLRQLYLLTGKMRDTSVIANPGARIISEEITQLTNKIYDRRQKTMTDLSTKIAEGVDLARVYVNLYLALVLISCSGLCWFIIYQFRDQIRLIKRLDISEKKAVDALQIKENFLANMSHEIRTPLNSILGFTNLLKKKKMDADSEGFVNSIRGAGENLLSIVNDILDLSKIEAGMMRLEKSPFSLRGLVHSVETLFWERLREKNLILKTIVDIEIPDILIGDSTRLTQILVNLMGNAIKFSEGGIVSIVVSANRQQGDQIEVRFKVSDYGIGISKEKLNQIFDRFSQAEESITRNYGGTGLGLSIVKNLVNIQHGDIMVKSEIGKGTEFSFFIPYMIAPEQAGYEKLAGVEVEDINLLEDIHILVVDDNAMNQSLMQHLLSGWKVNFDMVANGKEAIDRLGVVTYDLILMDIQMPVMDGLSATCYIREKLKLKIPIIAMTAHAMAGEREKCIINGMNDYISKPINEATLKKIISDHCGAKSYTENRNPKLIPRSFIYLDLEIMKEVSKGNTGYEKKITEQFIGLVSRDLSSLEKAVNHDKLEDVNAIAHDLKTTMGIMGLLKKTGSLLDHMEYATSTEGLMPILEKLAKICRSAKEEAMELLKNLEQNP